MKVYSSKFAQFGVRTNRLAPVFSIIVMLGASFLMANPVDNDSGIAVHRARIAAEMGEFPYQLDAWYGEDVPIPTSAEEILRPNSLVSRRYRRLNGTETIVIAFIHCSDIRDMLGHHPPHCYPASGWSQGSYGTSDLAIKLAGETVLMRAYRFRRLDQIGIEQQQTVLSMFLLPDSRRVIDMGDLSGPSSKGRRSSAMGVAQLQLVFRGNPTNDTLAVLASDLLTHVPRSLIDALDAPITIETEIPKQQTQGGRGSDQ
jgi:hypothetical protein